MSITPPTAGTPPSGAPGPNDSPSKQSSSRWGTVSGGMRSPPPAPSSGASVRRNHTIHGARQHDKPRLEKHFEQPENFEQLHSGSHQGQSSPIPDASETASSSSPLPTSSDPLASPSTRSDVAEDFSAGFVPLQALYSKASVSRNNSLPTRHSSRLSSHLSASATQGRSSLFNSLSAITGGSDHDEHEWERMIRAGGALGDDSKDLEESLDTPWTDPHFSHQRFPSGATSAHPRSPIVQSDFLEGHHRSGSSSAMEAFDQALPASSPLGSGFLRRHQSLNHHSGRSGTHRLAGRSSDFLGPTSPGPTATSISAQIEQAFSPRRGGLSMSAASSPIASSTFSKAPWNQPSSSQAIGSPTRFTNSFPSPAEGRMTDQQRDGVQPAHGRMASSDSPSRSLMDIHASLAKLDIRGSFQPTRGDPMETRGSTTPTGAGTAAVSGVGTPQSGLPERPRLLARNSSADLSIPTGQSRKLPSLITNRDVLARSAGGAAGPVAGPASAAAFVPPIGHAHSRQQSHEATSRTRLENDLALRFGPFSAAPAPGWQEKDQLLGRQEGGPREQGGMFRSGNDQWGLGLSAGSPSFDTSTLALSLTLAQEQQRTAMMQAQAGLGRGLRSPLQDDARLFGMRSVDDPGSIAALNRQLRGTTSSPYLQQSYNQPPSRVPGLLSSPGRSPGDTMSVPSLGGSGGAGVGIGSTTGSNGNSSGFAEPSMPLDPNALTVQKGYNPAPGAFDLSPPAARFFVIKSYTEDDVHKSLKYEIWASTDKGNQRLDKAFRESAHTGPIYLFFSVNASGHFCGMAQMLTPLDYTTSSNVWAQDGKWKGTFKVRWIYVKDLPNNQLRHIRLHNTPEVKPVTQSRDTQELTPDAGREVLRIMADYQAKTSLLQDFNFYEVQSQQQAALKVQTQAQLPSPPQLGHRSLNQAPLSPAPLPHQLQHQQGQQRSNAPRGGEKHASAEGLGTEQARRGNGHSPLTSPGTRNGRQRADRSPMHVQGRQLSAAISGPVAQGSQEAVGPAGLGLRPSPL